MDEANFSILKQFFATAQLSEEPIRLDVCSVIESPRIFVEAHLEHLKANMGKANSEPYFSRLVKLKKILEDGSCKH